MKIITASFAFIFGSPAALLAAAATPPAAPTARWQPTMASLAQHQAPAWLLDAKLGVQYVGEPRGMDDTECYHWTRAAQRARQVGAIASDADLRENFDTLNEVQNVKHVWLIEPPKDLDALMQVYRRTGARFLVSMLWGAYPGTEGLRMTAEETAAARRAGLRGVRPGSRPTYPRHCRTNFVEVLAQRLGDPVNAPIPQVSSAARLSPAGLTCAAGGINSLLVKTTYSITHAQAKLPAIVRTVQSGRVVAVSKRNETVAFVISRERMESLLETMELLSNPDFMRAWRAEKAGRGGKLYPASSLAD